MNINCKVSEKTDAGKSPLRNFALPDSDGQVYRKNISEVFPDLTPYQLARWAAQKKGPPYQRDGRHAAYRVSDVAAYLGAIAHHSCPAPKRKLQPFEFFGGLGRK